MESERANGQNKRQRIYWILMKMNDRYGKKKYETHIRIPNGECCINMCVWCLAKCSGHVVRLFVMNRKTYTNTNEYNQWQEQQQQLPPKLL